MRKAPCERCQKYTFVNKVAFHEKADKKTPRQLFEGELCADCFDEVDYKENRVRTQRGGSSGNDHNNPWLDNAVRALEEDR